MRRALPHPSLVVGLALMGAIWASGYTALGEWSVHPSIPFGVGALLALYALAVGPLREARDLGPPVPFEQWLSFVTGAVVLFVALTGPVHDLSDSYLFSAHMIQHLMITLLAPPLLLIQGTKDELHAGTVAYAGRLKQAGARYELVLLDGAPHGTENWAGHAEWEFYKQRMVDWLNATLRK